MIVCPSCGEENPKHARFRLSCGQALVTESPAGEERKVVSVLRPAFRRPRRLAAGVGAGRRCALLGLGQFGGGEGRAVEDVSL
jgi:hypothetical protein